MEVEPHVLKTVAQIPDHELRQLAAKMLARLIHYDGVGFVLEQFPVIERHWVDPVLTLTPFKKVAS